MSDLRRSERQAVVIEAHAELEERHFQCLIRDLSPFGGFVSTEEIVRPGAIAKLRFELPEGTEHRLEARVIRMAGRRDDHIGFGVEFLSPFDALAEG